MMFISQLRLNSLDRNTISTLSDIYRLHQTVMKGFSAYSNPARVLYRVEPEQRNGNVVILVQSADLPDWTLVADGRRIVAAPHKKFSPDFHAGDRFRFRLRANPTICRDGKRFGLVREEALLEWLQKKENPAGLRLATATVIDEGYIVGRKREGEGFRRLDIKIARFEGVLEVTNPQTFTNALLSGIGPAKAFGCGLMSLARG